MIYGYARVSTEAQDLTGSTAQLKAAGCHKIFREKITGTTADGPQLKKLVAVLAHGDVVIIPAVDRLSRDTTDLLIIAGEMQRGGAGIRSLAEAFLDTTSDFAEIVFAILGVAAKLERRRILERTARGRADAKANGVKFGQADPHPAPAERGPQAPRSRRDAAQRRPQLQCQPKHDFEAYCVMISEPTTNQVMNSRYLYYLAKENLESGQTVRLFAGVNLLHDAVEAMLWAIASHKGQLSKERAELIQLYDDVDAAISPERLSFRPKIVALNKRRINSKHYGICPDKKEATRLLESITEFLEDSFKKGLGANFWTVSLLDLLTKDEVNSLLREAQDAFEQTDYIECATACRKVIFVLFESLYNIERHKQDWQGNAFFGIFSSRAPYYTRNADWIAKNVKTPFDYIQIDHDHLNSDLLARGIEPSAFWNIWRGTPAVYRYSSKDAPWLCKRNPTIEAAITEEHAAYLLEQAIDIALRVEEHNRKVCVIRGGNFFIRLRAGGVNVYSKADRSSEVTAVTEPDVREVSVREGVPGLDGGKYWRIFHQAEGETSLSADFISGYVHNDDVDWSNTG